MLYPTRLVGSARYELQGTATTGGGPARPSTNPLRRGLSCLLLYGGPKVTAAVRHPAAGPYDVGNRDANRALYMICMVRMGRDRRTKEYVARRTAEGKSRREILRCLKRYIAREAYRMLVSAGSGAT